MALNAYELTLVKPSLPKRDEQCKSESQKDQENGRAVEIWAKHLQ